MELQQLRYWKDRRDHADAKRSTDAMVGANMLETQTSSGSLQTVARLIDAGEIKRCIMRFGHSEKLHKRGEMSVQRV